MKLLQDHLIVRMMERTASKILLTTEARAESTMVGVVIETSDACTDIHPGEFVRFMPFAGIEYTLGDKACRIIRIRDVILIHGDEFETTRYCFTDQLNLQGKG